MDSMHRQLDDPVDDPSFPPDLGNDVRRLALDTGVDFGTVRLAAQLKVAVVVTGSPDLPDGLATWRDLIGWTRTPEGRQQAVAAWHVAG